MLKERDLIKFRDRKRHKTDNQEDRNGDISGGTGEMVKSSDFEVRKTTIALLITGI